MCKRKTSAISGSEPLPQVHWIHNTDLTEFVYKLHIPYLLLLILYMDCSKL